MDKSDAGWLPLITARQLALAGRDSRPLHHDHVRVRRGVFVETAGWQHAEREQRHLLRMRAVAETRRSTPVFSHVSAGILWGVPIVGRHLDHVHLAGAGGSVARSKNGVVWHHESLEPDELDERLGFVVTSFRRTVLDLARSLPFASAVAVVDHALRSSLRHPDHPEFGGATRAGLLDALAAVGSRRGVRPARAAIQFADPRSASPGESISRANIHLLGLPAPELQVSFPRSDGGRDIVDFDWPEFDTFGEFDGLGKYVKPEFLKGRTTQEAVMLEKARENRIRKHRSFGARWDWPIAMRPSLLRAELLQAGLRPAR
ncbi:hypothetical protein LQ757_14815 [Agromyces sp. SYSU K20354]|uniref:hypothetical protein n=1 Tax=Agromyces cavernae TaxID=2898659 RepID=UPI001E4144B8|nr:hypothetical protein [Agromyces cavernae]MCD2443550.1 hypothetical protein [Agromyces cavernae]